MPVYEYRCTECSKHIEVTQRITDATLTRCNSCGGKLKRLITNTSFVLKGSGWYITDYPSQERKKAIEAKKGADTNKDIQTKKTSDSKKAEAVKAE